MLKAKLRKSIGTVERELLKSGKKFNTYKMSFEDFDAAIEDLIMMDYDDMEIAVAWKVGCDSKSVPLKMEFVHQFATSVKVVSKNSGQTLLKWGEK